MVGLDYVKPVPRVPSGKTELLQNLLRSPSKATRIPVHMRTESPEKPPSVARERRCESFGLHQ